MENITKRFGKVTANKDVTLELYKGEILSLLGENGSGKTTLMNMLSGIYFPDEGQIYIDGQPVTIASPKDAFALGIGMIHQHFKLVDVFTATENIILGMPGKLNLAEARKKVKEICDRYGFDIDPDQKIYDMSVSQKQTVEIVKVLYRGANILILDEPTAVLTPQETDKLFAVMRNMKNDGKSLIIITHKLHEVLDVSDRVAVLRKGEYIGDVATKDADQQSLTDMMVGHTVSLNISRPEPKDVEKRLVIEGLTAYDELGVKRLDDVSFTINAGEVLGIAGVAGSGQRELLEAIAGLYPVSSGHVTFCPPDGEKEKELVGLDPKRTLESYPHELSGGQRQRVLIAMALTRDPKLVICDEPTTALDVTVQKQVIKLLNDLQAKLGFAMIFVSHDLALVAEVAHNITVMYAGQVIEQAPTKELLTNPIHEYTRGLLGSVLSIESGSGRLHQVPGAVPSPRDFPKGDRFAPRSSHPRIGLDTRPVFKRVPGTEHFYSELPDEVLKANGLTPHAEVM